MSKQPTPTNDEPWLASGYGLGGDGEPERVFIARMKRERERRGWSQAKLAENVNRSFSPDALQLHATAITKLEWALQEDKQARNLRLNEALGIAQALGSTVAEMLTDNDLMDWRKEVHELQDRLGAIELERVAMLQRLNSLDAAGYSIRTRIAALEARD